MSAPLEMKPKKPVEKDAAAVEAEDEKMALESRSLFFFAPIRRQDGDSRIRSFMVALVRKKWFDRLILFAILANCSILAMQTPIKVRRWSTWQGQDGTGAGAPAREGHRAGAEPEEGAGGQGTQRAGRCGAGWRWGNGRLTSARS